MERYKASGPALAALERAEAEVERLRERCAEYELKADENWKRAERADRQLRGAVDALAQVRTVLEGIAPHDDKPSTIARIGEALTLLRAAGGR